MHCRRGIDKNFTSLGNMQLKQHFHLQLRSDLQLKPHVEKKRALVFDQYWLIP